MIYVGVLNSYFEYKRYFLNRGQCDQSGHNDRGEPAVAADGDGKVLPSQFRNRKFIDKMNLKFLYKQVKLLEPVKSSHGMHLGISCVVICKGNLF